MSRPPRIVAISPGEPLHPATWSGISQALLLALQARGVLSGAVNGRPSLLSYVEKAASFSPDRERWGQWYNAGSSYLSPATRGVMSRLGGWRAWRRAPEANALLQFTGWYRAELPRRAPPMLRCAYHDGNLAVFLRRPDLKIDRRTRRLRRALDFERRLHDAMDLILPMSEWLGSSFVEDFGQDPKKVVAVGAGANVRLPDPPPERTFERPRLLFVGKQFERKGGPDVIRAFSEVRARRPDAELWIVGPVSLEVAGPGIRLFGRISRDGPGGEAQIERLYRDATLFVMPSLFEPFGVALLEAMAYRLPCVGSTACAIPEIVDDGATGYVVPPADPEALAQRLLALIDEPGHARDLGEAGFRRFLERYTWDAVAGRIAGEIERRL